MSQQRRGTARGPHPLDQNLTLPGMTRDGFVLLAQIQIAYNERFPICNTTDFATGVLDGLNGSLTQSGFARATMAEIFPPSQGCVEYAASIPAPRNWKAPSDSPRTTP